MTPHKSNRRGTYRLDRVIDGVGRIARSSGTTERGVFKQINAMLTALAMQGRIDILREIRDGNLRPLTALDAFRRSAVDQLPSGSTLRPLAKAWTRWVRAQAATEVSPAHIRALTGTLRHLNAGERPIHELPELLRGLIEQKLDRVTTCHHARSHARAFVRDTLGMDHPLYKAVVAVPVPKRRKGREKGRPRSLEEIRQLVRRLDADAAAMVWSLCATGMGPKEYWTPAGWEERDDRVVVHGTKREGRKERPVPRWTRLVYPTMGQRKLAKLVQLAMPGVLLYDFRRTFSRWCEEAGIIDSNAEAYMGHGPRTMKALYRAGEVPGQLLEDAEKLRVYAGEPAFGRLKVTGT